MHGVVSCSSGCFIYHERISLYWIVRMTADSHLGHGNDSEWIDHAFAEVLVQATRCHKQLLLVVQLGVMDGVATVQMLRHRWFALVNKLQLVSCGSSLEYTLLGHLWMLDVVATGWKVDLIVIRWKIAIHPMVNEHMLLLYVFGAAMLERRIVDYIGVFSLVCRVTVGIGN